MIEATIHIETDEGPMTRALSIPENMQELNARGFVNILLEMQNWPEWLTKWASFKPEDQEADMALWSEEEFAEYFISLLGVIASACNVSIGDLRELPVVKRSKLSGVIPLATGLVNAVGTYEPKERKEFTHKGKVFVLPTSEAIRFGEIEQQVFAPRAAVGEVIEALQRQHIFNVQDENGEHIMKDRLYYSDLAVVACLAREKKPNGAIEKAPMGLQEFGDFVNKRMAFFSDMPADVFRDVGFFLLNSSKKRFHTLTSDLFSKTRARGQATPKKRRPRWPKRKS